MEKNPKQPNSKEKPHNAYARYSGLAFKMIAIILAGFFAGRKLDEWIELKFPIFTLILILSSVILSMYVVISEFTKKP